MGIKILDCTLRDGGYVNNWMFGEDAKNIVNALSNSHIDIIELGFLRNGNFTKQQTLFNRVKEVYSLISDNDKTMYSLMIRPDWYDITQLTEKADKVHIIRFAFYLKDKELTEKYCNYVRNLGYKVILNPVNICSYSKEDLDIIISFVNEVKPDYMTIVDTFGSLTVSMLKQLFGRFERELDKSIGIGCHLHDNMMLSSVLASAFIEETSYNRDYIIDASLNGMGRIPGNLPTEILCDIMNDHLCTGYYQLNDILSSISKYILPIKEKSSWGYSPAFYFSGKLKVHRSYPEYYLKDGSVSLDSINRYLIEISRTEKRWGFDKEFADEIKNSRGAQNEN